MKNWQFGFLLCAIIWCTVAVLWYWDGRLETIENNLTVIEMHYKRPCLGLPHDAKCSHKTVHFRMPGGSMRKEIRRVCGWSAEVEQKWKE
jgi:hypothetical protein